MTEYPRPNAAVEVHTEVQAHDKRVAEFILALTDYVGRSSGTPTPEGPYAPMVGFYCRGEEPKSRAFHYNVLGASTLKLLKRPAITPAQLAISFEPDGCTPEVHLTFTDAVEDPTRTGITLALNGERKWHINDGWRQGDAPESDAHMHIFSPRDPRNNITRTGTFSAIRDWSIASRFEAVNP